MKTTHIATIYAIAAAALYAINVPFSKILLDYIEPTMMAAFLYIGAGLGLFIYGVIAKAMGKDSPTESLTKKNSHTPLQWSFWTLLLPSFSCLALSPQMPQMFLL